MITFFFFFQVKNCLQWWVCTHASIQPLHQDLKHKPWSFWQLYLANSQYSHSSTFCTGALVSQTQTVPILTAVSCQQPVCHGLISYTGLHMCKSNTNSAHFDSCILPTAIIAMVWYFTQAALVLIEHWLTVGLEPWFDVWLLQCFVLTNSRYNPGLTFPWNSACSDLSCLANSQCLQFMVWHFAHKSYYKHYFMWLYKIIRLR